jgi:hypothetical protein
VVTGKQSGPEGERGSLGEGKRRSDDGMGMTAKQIDRALRRIYAAWAVSDAQSVTKRWWWNISQ